MEELLTVEEVAATLKVSSATVRRMLGRGDIKARKVGARQWRVAPTALESYIEGEVKPAKKRSRKG